jgi:hypothetical protein
MTGFGDGSTANLSVQMVVTNIQVRVSGRTAESTRVAEMLTYSD